MANKIAALAVIGLCLIGWRAGGAAGKPPEPRAQCPTTKMTSDCLTCHTSPGFKLKETAPDEALVYPNPNTRILFTPKEKHGVYYLESVTADWFRDAMAYFRLHGIDHIIVDIRSPGGSLMQAWHIVGMMRQAEAQGMIIETRVYGFAASAGFLIFVSGSPGYRAASEQAEMMWHELITLSMFEINSPSSTEEKSRVLRHLQDTASLWLAARSHLTKHQIDQKIKNKEFWMRGGEALELGFADKLLNWGD